MRTLTDKCRSGEGTDHACLKEARAAIKTTDGARFTTVLYYDDRGAPKIATRYCKEHAVATLFALAADMIAPDD